MAESAKNEKLIKICDLLYIDKTQITYLEKSRNKVEVIISGNYLWWTAEHLPPSVNSLEQLFNLLGGD